MTGKPTIDGLQAALSELHLRTRETPLFNPVFQLSHDLSRQLEAGELTLDDIESLLAELEHRALQSRANRLRRLILPDDVVAAPEKQATPSDFESWRKRWEQPWCHAVFTAHPTFLLTPTQSDAVATAATTGEEIAGINSAVERPQITLAYEHRRAMGAIANAQDARDAIVSDGLKEAQRQFPSDWHHLAPMPFRFASWVGYDMDGRTDIKWYTSFGFRLAEKAERLSRYAGSLRMIDDAHPLLRTIEPAAGYAQERADDFAADLTDPADLSIAANRLAADDPNKLLSLAPMIAELEDEATNCPAGRGIALKTLAAAMRADGLGMGWIHFRVNATQLHNAIRRRIDTGNSLDLASKGAIGTLREMLNSVRPLKSNLAALAIESSTAIRQFLAMAQIIQHVDADTPIRMLIAECEQPSTVLAALYFARLFGIEDKVDISPLFETESALEHGGRFLDVLLAEDTYRDYVRKRGRVCIQTGFSDAGRFIGQIPASLAIERLQGRLAQAMVANELGDCAALIFNTHGESMGRGAHPASFADRLTWPLSPWSRRQFAKVNIRLEPEASFQGGDGYLFFATPELARATLTGMMNPSGNVAEGDVPDSFYRRTDLSLDFYRAVKDHQQDHLRSRIYARAITGFGLGLLNETGSRKSRRQSGAAAERNINLRQIRAIPHNAILQQLGYPVNVIAGIGSASDDNYEELAALLADSARGRQLVRLVRSANALASIKTVAAYGELFNTAYWASRPYRGTEAHLSGPCEQLAEYLIEDDRTGVFRRLASRLRVDALKLHRLLDLLPDEEPLEDREQIRRTIGILQALRLVLLKHMFLNTVSIPAFSRANDISRSDVLEMVFTLRIDEALAQLRRAYPVQFPGLNDFSVESPSEYPDGAGEGYSAIRSDYVEPIERAHKLNLRISTTIANLFGAHG